MVLFFTQDNVCYFFHFSEFWLFFSLEAKFCCCFFSLKNVGVFLLLKITLTIFITSGVCIDTSWIIRGPPVCTQPRFTLPSWDWFLGGPFCTGPIYTSQWEHPPTNVWKHTFRLHYNSHVNSTAANKVTYTDAKGYIEQNS